MNSIQQSCAALLASEPSPPTKMPSPLPAAVKLVVERGATQSQILGGLAGAYRSLPSHE